MTDTSDTPAEKTGDSARNDDGGEHAAEVSENLADTAEHTVGTAGNVLTHLIDGVRTSYEKTPIKTIAVAVGALVAVAGLIMFLVRR